MNKLPKGWEDHYSGKDCVCAAHGKHECGCEADWTDHRVYELQNEVNKKQLEINRLRRVLHEIAESRPDEHMSVEKNPELVNWICDACRRASVGAYPQIS